MKKQVTLTAIILSLLTLILVGCGDSGTNAPTLEIKNIAGTMWKFEAYVDESKNEYIKADDIDTNLREYNASLSLSFLTAYYNQDAPKEKLINVIGYGCELGNPLAGSYEINQNDNQITIAVWDDCRKIIIPKYMITYYQKLNETKYYKATEQELKLYPSEDKKVYIWFKRANFEREYENFNYQTFL